MFYVAAVPAASLPQSPPTPSPRPAHPRQNLHQATTELLGSPMPLWNPIPQWQSSNEPLPALGYVRATLFPIASALRLNTIVVS